MKPCKTCKEMIAKSAKTCPHCGATCKKPFYKRIWVWLLVFILLVSAAAGSDSETVLIKSISMPVEDAIFEEQSEIEMTQGQENALKAAQLHLASMPFSHEGLVEQLVFEGFTKEEATFAADYCGANWMEQATEKAKLYLDTMPFSRDGLIHQLNFEGFTKEEAVYGVTAVGY